MVWRLTSEQQLSDTFHHVIEPFWDTQVTLGQFSGTHGTRLHYAWCIPEQPRACVVISSGRIESLLKYKEVIFDLFHNGFAVFILDHRGQGLSGRLTEDPHHGFVADFGDYVCDLLDFVSQQVRPRTSLPLSLLCHSMGGAIGALAMLEQPKLFERAVLCSPMFGIRPAMPDWLARSVIATGLWANRVRRRRSGYFVGQKGYAPVPFGLNKLTHSEVRYRLFRELYESVPEIQLGGVTSEWLAAAHRAMNRIEKEATNIRQPVLVISAGGDEVVDNQRQAQVAAGFPRGRLETIAHARHELLIEQDAYRNPAMILALDFLG